MGAGQGLQGVTSTPMGSDNFHPPLPSVSSIFATPPTLPAQGSSATTNDVNSSVFNTPASSAASTAASFHTPIRADLVPFLLFPSSTSLGVDADGQATLFSGASVSEEAVESGWPPGDIGVPTAFSSPANLLACSRTVVFFPHTPSRYLEDWDFVQEKNPFGDDPFFS